MPTSPTPADRPADQLRAAAEKLRALASAATPGPWKMTGVGDFGWSVSAPGVETPDTEQGRTDAELIALMHPGVGLAVARWLESWSGVDLSEHGPMPEDAQHALAVARQLLGTTTSEGPAAVPSTAAMLSTPCDACDHTLNWHRNDVGCTVPRCVCGRFQDPVEAAAPPAPADRAAVLREAAEIAESLREFTPAYGARKSAQISENVGVLRVADHLRRLAGEAAAGVQQTTEAHPPSVEYIAEVLELDESWEYLGAHADPAVAARRRASVTRRHPDAETRTVRKTTTYTVEPTEPPTHLPKGTNAEDCPACKGTNPDYPFLCPGPPAAPAVPEEPTR